MEEIYVKKEFDNQDIESESLIGNMDEDGNNRECNEINFEHVLIPENNTIGANLIKTEPIFDDVEDINVKMEPNNLSGDVSGMECDYLKESFEYPLDIEEHKPDLDTYSCFKTKGQKKISTSSNKVSELQMCGVSNKKLKTIKRNVEIHSDKEAQEYKRSNKTPSDRHMIIHPEKKSYECSICKKIFSRSSNLSQHLRAHAKKPHECSVCKKIFKRPSTLNEHLRIHTLEKPHECSVCKKTFSQSGAVTQHLRTHTLERPHQCSVCKKTFSQSSTLSQHLRTHTLEKPHKCSTCRKEFSHSSNLIRHMRIHTGIKPHDCNVCMKSFSRSSTLTQHMRRHT